VNAEQRKVNGTANAIGGKLLVSCVAPSLAMSFQQLCLLKHPDDVQGDVQHIRQVLYSSM
jgi:hypothetical protein